MSYWNNKRLYLILDSSYLSIDELPIVTQQCCENGVDIIQFRDKKLSDKQLFSVCKTLKKIISYYKVPFIINDRLDIALAIGASGVHLGQDDLPIPIAREICNRIDSRMIIGASTHSMEQAQKAVIQLADYIAVGPLFPTQTKPDYTAVGLDLAKQIAEQFKLPVFGIGGINEQTIQQVYATGLTRIAVVSAILQSDDRKKTIQHLKTYSEVV